MTCIVGWAKENTVTMGCDSAAVDNSGHINKTLLPKVFRAGNLMIGYTSSFRMGQLLQYNLEFEENKNNSDMKYLVKQVVPNIRKCLKEGGYTTIKDNEEIGGQFLLGYKGLLYEVASDFQVNIFTRPFNAVGSGQPYALGALSILNAYFPTQDIKPILWKALTTAAQFNCYVTKPFSIHTVTWNTSGEIQDYQTYTDYSP
jgi:ATP-dependent protease HslVU (ClpYQ) peptidase subunit